MKIVKISKSKEKFKENLIWADLESTKKFFINFLYMCIYSCENLIKFNFLLLYIKTRFSLFPYDEILKADTTLKFKYNKEKRSKIKWKMIFKYKNIYKKMKRK